MMQKLLDTYIEGNLFAIEIISGRNSGSSIIVIIAVLQRQHKHNNIILQMKIIKVYLLKLDSMVKSIFLFYTIPSMIKSIIF